MTFFHDSRFAARQLDLSASVSHRRNEDRARFYNSGVKHRMFLSVCILNSGTEITDLSHEQL